MDSEPLQVAQFLDRARELFPRREIVSALPGSAPARFDVAEYGRRVDRLCRALSAIGIGAGDRVATLAWNDHRHLELYMAVPRSGAVLHTINLRLDSRQIGEILAHAGDRALFLDPALSELVIEATAGLDQEISVVVLGGLSDSCPADWRSYEDWLAAVPESVPPELPAIAEESVAAMSYSSATTGRPKGVAYTHRALYLHSAMLAMADTWAISHRDTVLPVVPMFHVNAWGIPFTALWMGSKIVLPGARPSAETLVRLLVEEEVSFAAAVPTVWMDVLEILHREGVELPSLRMMISGGGPLPAGLLDLADRLGLPLTHSYGMTEAAPLTHVNRPKHGSGVAAGSDRRQRLRQGLLVPGLRMRVLDEEGNEVPRDGVSPGELHLRGPWVAESYLDDRRSVESFVDGWYRTGDVVNVDADGYVLIVDRKQDLIKSGGEWISSIELESALSEHEGVARAAAVAIPDPRWQERPLVFVQPQPGWELEPEELRGWLEQRLPRWWVPERIELVGAIPVTTVGKIDKRALREGLQEGRGEPPLTDDNAKEP